jgi:hypothetical protein
MTDRTPHPLESPRAAPLAAYPAPTSRRRLLAVGLAALLAGAAHCGPAMATVPTQEVLQFGGIVDGVRSDLLLRRRGTRFEGELREHGMTLALAGEVDRNVWRGRIELPGGLGLRLPFQAESTDQQIVVRLQLLPTATPTIVTLQRVDGASGAAGAPGTPRQATAAAGGGGRIEPAMVGRWVHDNVITSPGGAGGFGSFATRRVARLGADGRAVMTSVSAGGGGSWSSSGGERVEFSGRWEMRGDQLWVAADGGAFEPIARVSMVDGRLVLYTGNGRQIWTR